MPTVAIVGTQWGDEGKGKLVDCLTREADVVARFAGGHNAGHTVVIGEEQFILHLLPSGILHPDKLSLIGNGTVVEPRALIKELDDLKERGIEVNDNLMLSYGAHLIMPYHMAVEAAEEKRLGKGMIGTTLKGIGPAYTDKVARVGLKVGDLLMPEVFREKLAQTLELKNALLEKVYGAETFAVDAVYDEYMGYAERLDRYIGDTETSVHKAITAGRKVLFEGAQGTLLDIDHGTYPFVTSSNASAGGICTGLGIGPGYIDRVIGVVKAYTTRVGSGPFPTEIHGELGEKLREEGGEYGATTGRPRRCGWLDAVALRHAVRVNSLSGLAVTKLDVLDMMDELKICTSYHVDGKEMEDFPSSAAVLERCEPQYETHPGWKSSTTGLQNYDDLPPVAQDYLRRMSELLGVKVVMISTGPRRDELITVESPF